MGLSGEKSEIRTEEIFEEIINENFPQINAKYQSTDLGSSVNTKRDKFQKKIILQKIKDKEKNLEKSQRKLTLCLKKEKVTITLQLSETMQVRRQ